MEQDVDTGFRTVCSACLSSDRDRKLFDLNNSSQANHIFQLIMYDFAGDRFGQSIPEMEQLVCWECLALLKKFRKFKWQVHSAQEHLRVLALSRSQESTDYKYMPQSLSCLKIETKVEYNKIFFDSAAPEEQGPNSFQISNIKSEQYNVTPVARVDKILDIHDHILKDPLITTEQSKPKYEKKYVEIEVTIKKEHNDELVAPNIEFNHVPQKVFLNPTVETIVPSGIKEPATVTLEVPNLVKNEESVPNLKGKKTAPNRKGKNTVPKQEKGKKNVSSSVKGKKVIPNVKSKETLSLEGGKKKIPSRRCKKTIPGQLKDEDTDIENEKKPKKSISEDEKDEVTCKILSRTEMNKFRDRKREKVLFKGAQFKCEKCIEKFSSQENLDEHNKKHDEARGNSICDVCEQRFQDPGIRNEHFQEHFKVYECTKCSYQNLDRVKISDHIRRIHVISTFDCNNCDAVFKTFKEKRQHCLRVHYKKPTCNECGKSFTSTTGLQAHLAGTHRGEKMECTICKKKVKGASMKSHMKLHDPTPEETVYCVDCGTTYKNKQCYAVHLRTSLKHNTIEQLGFKCEQCNKYFTSKTCLKDHIEIEHIGGDFTCETCKKVFKSKRILSRHVRCVHERILPKVKLRICEICGKSFKTRIDLVHHINSHLGHRPYVCQDCGDTFSYAAALYTHRRLIHKVKKKSEMNS